MNYNFKTPGKLYIIGEYNVLKPGHKAIVMSVDMFVETNIKKTNETKITYNNKPVNYNFNSGVFEFGKDVLFSISSTINTIIDYLKCSNIKLINFDLNILNNLQTKRGKKYGLGSSAAISVGIARSLLQLHGVILTNLELFKLLVLSQYQFNTVTSGGDLASAIFENIIVYQRYDTNFLSMFSNDDYTLIKKDWPLLKIDYLNYKPFQFKIVYTNKPNLKKVKTHQYNHEFYDLASELVDEAIINFEKGIDVGLLMTDYQKLLNKSFNNKTLIRSMKRIIKKGNKLNYHVKQSGGGRGDCMILFPTIKSIPKKFKNELEVNIKNG